MINIKKILYSLIFVFLLFSVHASDETDWLVKEYKTRDRSIEETSLALIALDSELDSTQFLSEESTILKNTLQTDLKDYLETCINPTSNSCNNKDTALAIWALDEIGDNSNTLEDATNWLINSRTMFAEEYDIEADWLVQIVSPSAGPCTVNNTELEEDHTFNVQKDYTPWETITDLVDQSTKDLVIDCTPNVKSISLIKKKTISGVVNYFIKEEKQNQKNVQVQLGIPCWGPTYRSTCNPDTTAYVLLALHKRSKSPDPTWLQQQTLTSLENSILYQITLDQTYLSRVEASQAASGYWSPRNIATTSLIYSLLPDDSTSAKNALEWILDQKAQDVACWPRPSNLCTVKASALAIYSVGSQTSSDNDGTTTPPIGDRTELDDCDAPCLDEEGCICEADCVDRVIEEGENCGGPDDDLSDGTRLGEYCIRETTGCDGQYDSLGRCQDIPGDGCPSSGGGDGGTSSCNNDNTCDASEDCACLDCKDKSCITPSGISGTCNYFSEQCEREGTDPPPPPSPPDDKGGNLFWFLLVIAALIALVGGTILAYKKGLIKFNKKHKPSATYTPKMRIPKEFKPEEYRPRTRPSARKAHPVKKFLDKELDNSIDELEKLLKD